MRLDRSSSTPPWPSCGATTAIVWSGTWEYENFMIANTSSSFQAQILIVVKIRPLPKGRLAMAKETVPHVLRCKGTSKGKPASVLLGVVISDSYLIVSQVKMAFLCITGCHRYSKANTIRHCSISALSRPLIFPAKHNESKFAKENGRRRGLLDRPAGEVRHLVPLPAPHRRGVVTGFHDKAS